MVTEIILLQIHQKQELGESQVDSAVLLHTLEEFIKTVLTRADPPKPSAPLKDYLPHVYPLIENELEIKKMEVTFPNSILLAHSCALHEFLESVYDK